MSIWTMIANLVTQLLKLLSQREVDVVEVVTERQVNRAIAEGNTLTKPEAIWILEKAISIHEYFIALQTDDPNITGSDEVHEEWNAWYYGTMNLLVDGEDALITFEEAIDKLIYDAKIHLWYTRNLDYIERHPAVGGYWHHVKWYHRWLAIVELLKEVSNV